MRPALAFLLLLCATGSSSIAEPCRPIRGLEPLLGPGTVLLLGEIHGTVQSPAFALEVACHAARADLPVVVGLELSPAGQARVNRFVSSSGTDADRTALLAGSTWQRSYQDGRNSEAMFGLIDGVRRLHGEGLPLRVALFDAGGPQRDRAMAGNLTRIIADSPGALAVVLTGNQHSRTTRGSSRNRDHEPMGYVLKRDASYEKLIALNVAHGGGRAWICAPDCGIVDLAGRHGNAAWSIEIDEATRPAGHAGWYRVGSISASPPAQPSRHETVSAEVKPALQEPTGRTPEPAPDAPRPESASRPAGSDPGIRGEWQAYEFNSNARTWTMAFEGGRFRAESGPDDWYEGEFAVDPSVEPATIDFRIDDCRCSFKGETSRGIYVWDGQSIVISAPRPGSSRPREFMENSGRMMRLLRLDGD